MTAAYLSERQWGTVREDYSPHGTAWDYFPHDHAQLVEENRQRVYTDPEFELVYAPQWSNSSLRVALVHGGINNPPAVSWRSLDSD